MAELHLKSRHIVQIDEDDVWRVMGGHWHAVQRRNGLYIAGRPVPTSPVLYLSRYIMRAPPGTNVIYRNDDRLDCRKENLQVVRHIDAQRRMRANYGKSKYRGVSWFAQCQKWRAVIRVNGKQIALGLHDTEEEAAKAYDLAAFEMYGEFARLNLAVRG